ncbi:unnamed protein product [Rhizoctonia solani]|uniref:Uncharacterized protein n=1 Tax=Rhizoctonia solani TaxID=456999 RepID=A0A8H3CZG6_9AGAM|nr:unnamed protein product [Rhizoctonia solani]
MLLRHEHYSLFHKNEFSYNVPFTRIRIEDELSSLLWKAKADNAPDPLLRALPSEFPRVLERSDGSHTDATVSASTGFLPNTSELRLLTPTSGTQRSDLIPQSATSLLASGDGNDNNVSVEVEKNLEKSSPTTQKDFLLEYLRPSLSAWYDSSEAAALHWGACTAGTRTSELRKILDWV